MARRNRWLQGMLLVLLAALLALSVGGSSLAGTAPAWPGNPAKYVFLFIGDGMGMSQARVAETVLRGQPGMPALALSALPVRGTAETRSADSRITDSAAAATALATGRKTGNGVIGMDPGHRVRFETLAEMARDRGLKVGIVTSVPLDHATPAAFYAHQPSRKDTYEISMQLADSGFDYFAGGAFTRPTGRNKDAPDSAAYARSKGYRLVSGRDEFARLDGNSGPVVVFTRVDAGVRDDRGLSLADLTGKGIELLDNTRGFFMMVEGGKIDWACHANDAADAARETLAFDEAVGRAMAFAAKHPEETLVVVTGDHETGGMTLDSGWNRGDPLVARILLSRQGACGAFRERFSSYRKDHGGTGGRLEDLLPLVQSFFGLRRLGEADRGKAEKLAAAGDLSAREELALALSPEEMKALEKAFRASLAEDPAKGGRAATILEYGGYDPFTITLTRIRDRKAGIGWASCSHTAVPVPVYAGGRGQELFAGPCDNTDVAKRIMAVMGFAVAF